MNLRNSIQKIFISVWNKGHSSDEINNVCFKSKKRDHYNSRIFSHRIYVRSLLRHTYNSYVKEVFLKIDFFKMEILFAEDTAKQSGTTVTKFIIAWRCCKFIKLKFPDYLIKEVNICFRETTYTFCTQYRNRKHIDYYTIDISASS